MPGKAKPSARPPAKVAGVADAIDVLESRRRALGTVKRKSQGRRGDLDLDAIP